jgi:hypothetical protein
MLGRKNYPTLHLSLGGIGNNADEVYHKLTVAVRNDGQVAVNALGNFFGKLNVELILIFLFSSAMEWIFGL